MATVKITMFELPKSETVVCLKVSKKKSDNEYYIIVSIIQSYGATRSVQTLCKNLIMQSSSSSSSLMSMSGTFLLY